MVFGFQGIVQIRFESGLNDILDLSSRDTFTMAETTAYFEAYRHVLEGLREMKDSLPMSRYLVDCNPTIKPPQYLLSARGTGQMDLSSLLRDNSRCDASAVTIINPQRWPPLEQTTLNVSQVRMSLFFCLPACLPASLSVCLSLSLSLSLSLNLFLLGQLKPYVSIDCSKMFFKAHILAHMNYASTVWSSASEVHVRFY